jgi:hypothetical protein
LCGVGRRPPSPAFCFYKSGCPMQLRNGFGKEEKQLFQ